jgi:Immune inhibitor A peptidase M6
VLNPRSTLLAAAAVMTAFGLAGTGALAAGEPNRAGRDKSDVARGGIRHVDADYPFRFQRANGDLVPVRQLKRPRAAKKLRPLAEPQLGEVRNWAGLDLVHGALYPKAFALRGLGRKIEVWVATGRRTFAGASAVGTDYMDGDCRNGARTAVTDEQVQDLIRAFDRNIYPRESAVFSVPPSRDGTAATVGPPAFHPQGAGDRIVVLVDNIRDESFFDLNNTQNFGYAVGIYSSALERLFDRNMMSIDAFDWLHRTGRRPAHEPSADNCLNAPGYPQLIEGVFAHEYQHLLEHHEDPDEVDWLDEGLAEWARTLTGYVDPLQPASDPFADKHLQCFYGAPENSLTLWGDGDDLNCDYGAVYTLTNYLADRFGTRFMTALHRGDANGLAGLQEALGPGRDARRVLHDWAVGVGRRVNWDSPQAYASPGAPPNGADFVRLRDTGGRPVRARDLRALAFDGATAIPGRPNEWTVDATPPAGGGPALYTGAGNNLDRTIVRPLTVPAAGGTLVFQAQWNVEEDSSGGWDFTFVQVSTDGGATYRSIACTSSRGDVSPHARAVMRENLPGFTAYSGGWRSERCDLDAFAGRSILLAFRHVTDGSIPGDPDDPAATIPPGFWLRNLALDGVPVADGSTLSGWLSPSQARPQQVHGFSLQLVGYSSRGRLVSRVRVPLDATHDAALDRRALRRFVDDHADTIGAIVMYDEPTEQVTDYAPYRLTVNGVAQPGG